MNDGATRFAQDVPALPDLGGYLAVRNTSRHFDPQINLPLPHSLYYLVRPGSTSIRGFLSLAQRNLLGGFLYTAPVLQPHQIALRLAIPSVAPGHKTQNRAA